MDWFAIVAALGGIATVCGYIFWRWLKDVTKTATQAEVFKHESDTKSAALESVAEAKRTRDRLNADPDYARRVREKFTRSDP